MRISDWSSDVCSSDLLFRTAVQHPAKQGEEAMTTENAQLPEGGFPLAPHIVCAGAADAIAFYKEAFGATEMVRIPGPDGRLMHGAVLINGAMVMLVDEMPEHGTLSPKKLGDRKSTRLNSSH